MPARLVNLPNKQYWLAPQRREETLEWLKAYFGWLACGIYVVMIVAFDYAAQSNLHPDHPPGTARLRFTFGGFLLFVIVWLIRIFTRFGEPPRERLP